MGVDRHVLRGATSSTGSSSCGHLPLVFVFLAINIIASFIFVVGVICIVVVRCPGGRANEGRGRRRVRQSSHLRLLLLLLLSTAAGSVSIIIMIMIMWLRRRGTATTADAAALAVHRYHSSLLLRTYCCCCRSSALVFLTPLSVSQTWAVRRPPNWISEWQQECPNSPLPWPFLPCFFSFLSWLLFLSCSHEQMIDMMRSGRSMIGCVCVDDGK